MIAPLVEWFLRLWEWAAQRALSSRGAKASSLRSRGAVRGGGIGPAAPLASRPSRRPSMIARLWGEIPEPKGFQGLTSGAGGEGGAAAPPAPAKEAAMSAGSRGSNPSTAAAGGCASCSAGAGSSSIRVAGSDTGSCMTSSGTDRHRLPQIAQVPPGSLRMLPCSGQVCVALPWGSTRNRSGREKGSASPVIGHWAGDDPGASMPLPRIPARKAWAASRLRIRQIRAGKGRWSRSSPEKRARASRTLRPWRKRRCTAMASRCRSARGSAKHRS